MSNLKEIRDKAWGLLWISKWLNRFVFLLVAFGFIRYLAINYALSLLGSSADVLNERLMAATTAQEMFEILREPASMRSIALMMALAMFIAMIIDAVASYGLARIRLSVAGGNETVNWQRMGFSGLQDPFSMFSLAFLHSIFTWWPVLLVILPAALLTALDIANGATQFAGVAILPCMALSIIFFYRYRQTWFLKAIHNDWSALKCLRESAKMMVGRKWQCFRLDCTFWRPVTFMLSTALVAGVLSLVGAPEILAFLVTLLTTALNLYLGAYIPLGQAIFHLELTQSGDIEK